MGFELLIFRSFHETSSYLSRGGDADGIIFDILIPQGGAVKAVESNQDIGIQLVRNVIQEKCFPPDKCFVLTILRDPALNEELREIGIPVANIYDKTSDPETFASEVKNRL
jgi:hypothetical protein